jgi:Ca2+-binding EF-hand superfamily protein
MDVSAVASASGLHAVSSASYGAPPQQKLSNLFDSNETAGSGAITRSQFDEAFQTKNPPAVFQRQGADAIFAELDPNDTGSVSKQDFVSTITKLAVSLRAEKPAQSAPSPTDSLTASLQSLDQATTSPGSRLNLKA